MALNANYISGITDMFSTLGSYISASKKAKSDRKWQKYNNQLTQMQNAMNQNSITTNRLMARERTFNQKQQIDKSEKATYASAEAAAAASGTIGRSVNMVLFDINRNAATARGAADRDYQYQDMQQVNQSLSSQFDTATQLDLREITGPSAASLLFGIGNALTKFGKG